MGLSKKLRRGFGLKNAVAFVCVVVFVSCLFVLVVSMLRLPELTRGNETLGFYRGLREEKRLGELGEMMVGMLPDDLAFTVFVPSEEAFWRDVTLGGNDSLVEEKKESDNRYATVSRILGFSAVPRSILSVDVPLRKEVTFDSISGFRLHVFRDSDGSLMVNRVRSERVDLREREIVIHIMNGAIMDAEFEQSVRPDYEDEE